MELFYIDNDECVKDFVNLCAKMEFIAGDVINVLERPSVKSVGDSDFYIRSIKQSITQLSSYACKVAELELEAKIGDKSSISDNSDE